MENLKRIPMKDSQTYYLEQFPEFVCRREGAYCNREDLERTLVGG